MKSHTTLRTFSIILSTLYLICGSSFSIAEVYKWTDKDGKVHYSDKPQNADAKKLKLKPDLTPEQQQKAAQEAHKKLERLQRVIYAELEQNHEANKSQANEQQDAQKLARACQIARRELSLLKQQVRLAQTGKDGELEFLSDEQREAEIKKITKITSEHCNSD